MSGRRSKAIACTTCRRHKTRCEVLAPSVSKRCHRCDVLSTPCSYESGSSPSPRLPPPPSTTVSVPSPSPSLPSAQSTAWSNPKVHPPCGVTPSHVWAFIPYKVDWTVPITAMQSIAEQVAGPTLNPVPSSILNAECLEDVLSLKEIDHLLSVFDSTYTPWLNFIPLRSPFTDLVCCTIAIRHIGPSPRLVQLMENKVARMIFNPHNYESIETIQGLIILALWQGDGKVLISMAVSIALAMNLDKASSKATRRRIDGAELDEIVELSEKARLWIVLTNTESLLSLGSNRVVSSVRSEVDTNFFPVITPSNSSEGRDLRIRLLSETMNAMTEGVSVKTVARSEIDVAYKAISMALSELEGLLRVILPLSVISDHDRFHYHILQCIVYSCRQIVIQRGFIIARWSFGDQDISGTPLWFLELQVHGRPIVVEWGKDMIRSAECLLVTFLQCDSSGSLLGTCPDIVYTSLGFAASVVVGMRLYVEERMGVDLRGPGEMLLQRTVSVLERVSLEESHAAMKTAKVISMMLKIWAEKRDAGGEGDPSDAGAGMPGFVFNDDEFWAHLFGPNSGYAPISIF